MEVKEVCSRLGVSRQLVSRLIKHGDIKASIRYDGIKARYEISENDFLDFVINRDRYTKYLGSIIEALLERVEELEEEVPQDGRNHDCK